MSDSTVSPLAKRNAPLLLTLALSTVLGGGGGALLGLCGPFTDVAADSFCPFVLEIFTLGITTGTSPTTYDPTSSVTRLQMAAFLARTVDGALKRGSRRAPLDQFWTTQNASVLGLTTLPSPPTFVASDGSDLWVSSVTGSIHRVRASDGKLLETWTGAGQAYGIVVAMGRVFVAATENPGTLARIDPTQPAGAVTLVATNLGNGPLGLTFDGSRLWTANSGNAGPGSVSIVTPGATIPWTVTTVATGFGKLRGAVFDGANVWVTDNLAGTLLKLDAAGAILQTVTVGLAPGYPVYDGTNIWVPNGSSAFLSVVRASNGTIVGQPAGNGLSNPIGAAFDGQRVMITNGAAGTVSLFKAADLTPLGSFSTGATSFPYMAASDGVNFWIALNAGLKLARF